jgi:hypothetical protein
MRRPGFLLFFAFAFFGCSSKEDNVASTDAGEDVVLDSNDFEEPVFDSDDPLGRVLILPLYDPVKRCMMPATEIGHFDQNPDGTMKACGDIEVCYTRPDGILAYHNKDCVHGSNFRANWKASEYSDLGPCEVVKRLSLTTIKECPNTSCVFARDVTIDTARSCATAIESKGCRDVFGAPTSCFCNGTSAFVAANPKMSTAPPSGYTACDMSNDVCKKALAVVDTVKGCATMTTTDAGADVMTDATTDVSDTKAD